MDRALLSGSMGMLLLKLLSEGDKYGYEMIEELRRQSKNVFELKAGTMYPLLHGMEEKNLLSSYEREVLGKTQGKESCVFKSWNSDSQKELINQYHGLLEM